MKSKIFLITFTILIILIGFIPFSSANYEFTYNDTDYSLPDLPTDCLEFYYIEPFGVNFYLHSFSINNPYSTGDVHSFSKGSVADFSYRLHILYTNNSLFEPDEWIYRDNSSFAEGFVFPDTFRFVLSKDSEGKYLVLNSNFDIYVKNDLVFRKPVPTLGEVLEKTNPVKMFQITTSGMIVYLMVFLVSLVGFLKAWSILSNSLRKA